MDIKFIKKASGHIQKFSIKKLERSIAAATKHSGNRDSKLAERIAHEVLEHLEGQGKSLVESDTVRQVVLHVMKQDKHHKAAEAYEIISLRIQSPAIHTVIKRDGGKETFHPHKLFKSIKKSFFDAGVDDILAAEEITREIITYLEKIYDGKPVPVTEIRKFAAHLLREKEFDKVEKSYLLHKYL